MYRDAIVNYIRREARPVDKYGHQPRLYALALQVGAGLDYDDDILFATAWLHDLGVFIGHRPEEPEALARWNNVTYAMAKAPGILRETGFPGSKIPAVVDAIATHQPAGDPQTIEGIVLRDADILEQLGAVGALRTVCKIGRDTRFSSFTQAIASLNTALEKLPPQLKLETAKALAKPKIEILRAFLEAAQKESQNAMH